MLIILVGNKTDLNDERQVTTEEGLKFAALNKLLYFECSAMTGHNVFESFIQSATVINNKINSGELDIKTENVGVSQPLRNQFEIVTNAPRTFSENIPIAR